MCFRSSSPSSDPTSISEGAVSCTRSEERYLNVQYPTTTSTVPSSTAQSSFEASVWQQYRYYQSQFYHRHHQQYLPQYPNHQYGPGTDDAGESPHYQHSPTWLYPSSYHHYTGQHDQSQLHLADAVGITPSYHHFREMNGVCYDPVY